MRDSTAKNYYNIWKNFNKFIIKLDKKPKSWETGASLYGAFLVDSGAQSSTIRSYISAIKKVLVNDNYDWNDGLVQLQLLSKACKLTNDRLMTRLPISLAFLETILFEIERLFKNQYYLEILYKTIFLVSFYGLLHVGEATKGDHVIRAKDIYIADNKDKILLLLYSSKTHNRGSKPQEINIVANKDSYHLKSAKKRFFCPFAMASLYMRLRGPYKSDNDQFFIFRDNSPVCPHHVRYVLKLAIKNLNLDPSLYNFHSIRIGMATEMVRQGCPIEVVKRLGHWKSNTVYKYIKYY